MQTMNEIPLLEAIFRAEIAAVELSKRRPAISVRRRVDPIDRMLVDYMAEILPDEGLDLYLGQFPKNDTRITTLSLCLFKSQSSTTTITGSQTVAAITETTYSSYARQALATASWAAQGATAPSTDGRKIAYGSQISFPPCGATGDTIQGLFIGWDSGAGGIGTPTKCVGQANFDDLSAVTLVTNDVLKVTPSLQLNH
jgi:hypothetical protein